MVRRGKIRFLAHGFTHGSFSIQKGRLILTVLTSALFGAERVQRRVDNERRLGKIRATGGYSTIWKTISKRRNGDKRKSRINTWGLYPTKMGLHYRGTSLNGGVYKSKGAHLLSVVMQRHNTTRYKQKTSTVYQNKAVPHAYR